MKKVLVLMAVLLAGSMYPQQQTEPKYEKLGKVVKATFYHDNGLVAQTGYLLKGKLHGQWLMYNAAGKKIASGKYDNGKRTGKWFFWEGAILQEVDFVNNRMTNVKKWNQAEIVAIQ